MAHPGMDRRYSISDSDEGSEGLVGMDTLRGFGGGGSHLTESDGSPPSHDGSGAGDRPWSSSLSGGGSAGPKPRAMGSVGLSSQHRAQQAPPRAQTPMAVRHGAVDGSWLASSQGGGGAGPLQCLVLHNTWQCKHQWVALAGVPALVVPVASGVASVPPNRPSPRRTAATPRPHAEGEEEVARTG